MLVWHNVRIVNRKLPERLRIFHVEIPVQRFADRAGTRNSRHAMNQQWARIGGPDEGDDLFHIILRHRMRKFRLYIVEKQNKKVWRIPKLRTERRRLDGK